MKKGFLKGFILGGLFFSTISFAAVTYDAITASFPILINGEVWQSDKPAVVIDGSTYLPLKAIGDVLDVKVKWNSELRQVEIGEEQPSVTNKYSRLSPAPIGESQTIKISNYSEEYTATVEVKETIRGSKALKKLQDTNDFWNTEPEDGYEYIVAKISVAIKDVKDDKAIDINEYDFDCYSSNNVEYDNWFTVVTPEPALSTTLYDGGNITGYVVFKVQETDENPKIVFGQDYSGKGGIWFSL
ncbi:MAG: DUF4352 domain-containing protein [Clostridia bacterium]|nr:DUF4352 domain-containing protein [Clostridia bacterium]